MWLNENSIYGNSQICSTYLRSTKWKIWN
jgi:hypothetical protein